MEVSVRRAEQGALFGVRDTGVGIPGDDQPHVFARFCRVDKSNSRASGGTGLSIVKHAARIHDARITIMLKSEPGVGTDIRLLFPNVT